MVGSSVKERFSGTEEVRISHVDSPESFYLVRKKDKKLASNLGELLKDEWNKGIGRVENVGDEAVVNIDDKYSRVTITKITPDGATVSFVDEGHIMGKVFRIETGLRGSEIALCKASIFINPSC